MKLLILMLSLILAVMCYNKRDILADEVMALLFDPVEALRTPYRIDILQPIYFVIDSFDTLFHLAQEDLVGMIHEARRLGMHDPSFPPKEAA